jgi:hypothetical protein
VNTSTLSGRRDLRERGESRAASEGGSERGPVLRARASAPARARASEVHADLGCADSVAWVALERPTEADRASEVS